jgi:hypothetical protein
MDHSNALEHFVFDQHKTVSYKWLALELSVSAAAAKQLLSNLVASHGLKVESLHLVSGKSSGTLEFRLVPAADVDSTCKQCSPSFASHIYSVRLASNTLDSEDTMAADEQSVAKQQAAARLCHATSVSDLHQMQEIYCAESPHQIDQLASILDNKLTGITLIGGVQRRAVVLAKATPKPAPSSTSSPKLATSSAKAPAPSALSSSFFGKTGSAASSTAPNISAAVSAPASPSASVAAPAVAASGSIVQKDAKSSMTSFFGKAAAPKPSSPSVASSAPIEKSEEKPKSEQKSEPKKETKKSPAKKSPSKKKSQVDFDDEEADKAASKAVARGKRIVDDSDDEVPPAVGDSAATAMVIDSVDDKKRSVIDEDEAEDARLSATARGKAKKQKRKSLDDDDEAPEAGDLVITSSKVQKVDADSAASGFVGDEEVSEDDDGQETNADGTEKVKKSRKPRAKKVDPDAAEKKANFFRGQGDEAPEPIIKKRMVPSTRQYVDEDGYLVTEKIMIEVDDDTPAAAESAPAPPPPKKSPIKAPAPAPKKTVVKQQGSIASFFSKK